MVKVNNAEPAIDYTKMMGQFVSSKYKQLAVSRGFDPVAVFEGFVDDTKEPGSQGAPRGEEGCRNQCASEGREYADFLSASMATVGAPNIRYEGCFAGPVGGAKE